MIEQAAVEERGRVMGLQPRRRSLDLRQRVIRSWRMIPGSLMRPGDTLVDHGIVHSINRLGAGWATAYCGVVHRPKRIVDATMYKVFTEVQMRYAQIDGKGAVHIATTSMSVDSPGDTLCGKSGVLVLVADEEVKDVCAGCRKAADKQS